jgi:hypothetical protein
MLPIAFRCLLLCLCFAALNTASPAGMTSYTDPGKADFDTMLQIVNPYGSWSKIDGQWAFTPRDHQAPYTDGRWLYTEYGWYWKGRLPHSWVTEHYGYWKRGADKVWSWYPGPYWLPQTVEIRATSNYIGWRSGEVDDEGHFVEAPIDRFSKMDEWTFVTLAQFANPITPALVAPADVTKTQLEESIDSSHTYLTYREIDRPGPHPADFVRLCRDGGMFAPKTLREEAAAQKAPTTLTPAPVPAPKTSATPAPAEPNAGSEAPADARQVKYWITMSLPTYWSATPAGAKPENIYLYRPELYQDQDGIARRITLWFNPQARTNLSDVLSENSRVPPGSAPEGSAPAALPAVPATPESSSAGDAFRNSLDDPYPPGGASHPVHSSTKNPAPSGLKTPDAPSALPATNAAP